MDLEALADVYFRHYSEKRKEDFWAVEQVDEIVSKDPATALDLTLLLLRKTGNDDAALAYVAAGPLEDLLKRHGLQVIDQIEEECRNYSRLPLALSGVWGINPGNPLFERWYALMWKYGFAEGKRQPL